MTKIASARPNGKVRRTIHTTSIDDRIVQLHRALGKSVKEAYNELRWLNLRIETSKLAH
jgi:hypothetical protein